MSVNPLAALDKAAKIFDDNFESEQEAQAVSTRRQEIDISSPYKLPHLIRPIITIWSGFMWSINIIWALLLVSFRGVEGADALLTDPTSIVAYTLAATSGTFSTCIGFYFHSRRKEKQEARRIVARDNMNKDKLSAAMSIEKMQLKAKLEEEKFKQKEQKKDNRVERREEKRASRE
jgi:hypothetical protein